FCKNSHNKKDFKKPLRMGDFKGHVLPGSLLILFGLWWSVKYSLKHISRTPKKNSHVQRNFKHVEIIEGAVKVVLGLALMDFYFHFGFCNISEILWVITEDQKPCVFEQLLHFIGFLFQYHVSQRPMLDQHIHAMLLMAIYAGVATCVIQVFVHDNMILDLFSACLALLQGTWFWQIGFVLYPPWGGPEWDLNDHSNIMFITMCFCWHFALAILLMASNYTLVYCSYVSRIQKRVGGLLRKMEGAGELGPVPLLCWGSAILCAHRE
uniref:Transmembrane protein 45B n=1 Tax=Laticauda laticaudata TaxID=8630 RepID=A0A8C5RPV1_LATLA